MATYEGIRLKILKFRRKIFANYRRKKLINTDFTIISNNCWGGMIYESYNIPKNSPTVGMFFFAKDYIKFISNLKEYLECEIKFIKPEESKWKNEAKTDSRFGKYPIGILKDIEIFFLHYHSEQEAKEKWERKCKRVNFKKLLIKFNDQNGCTEKELQQFIRLPYKNKIFFTCKDWNDMKDNSIVKINQIVNKNFIMASYETFGKNRYINLDDIINNL